MIAVTNLSKAFGAVQAVQAVSFSAPNGKITGLLGPNGAGKSTTMRLIAGVLEPDEGGVTVDDLDAYRQRVAAQQRLGVLPDKRGVYQRLTSRENVRYYGRLHGLRGSALEARIDELMVLLEMADIADRITEGFSTGQKVKVAIARALVHNPPNIMLDEPTVGLDVMSTRAMRQVIRRLRDAGQTVLFSSHIMQEVASLCDNIVIIAHGRVAAQGSADDLRQRAGQPDLEEAFVRLIGSTEGLE
ncbi:MAG: ATP-binding cassette domain-containing protein [Chloroflexi bacterium]|nr:ATP-binding cassette domain-containing protein [Chloroflexota bacterium]MBK6712372.1 ATP-binding cassette domain-containing protein [Chloroflexota bacterium]MBK7178994.1 ATP-binding cassette domain-containing protein [Chloroflexota bacterium]MBK7916968.1 ATP-binding cassette domain-containing protein [Chloroflexota bacterium]MBK8933624.1 ATP-binding cassette domain-containing protein [Chloroflexota bacterium]